MIHWGSPKRVVTAPVGACGLVWTNAVTELSPTVVTPANSHPPCDQGDHTAGSLKLCIPYHTFTFKLHLLGMLKTTYLIIVLQEGMPPGQNPGVTRLNI